MPTRPPRPPMPRAARTVLWATGAFALLLLFAPALYVVKYYAVDRAREQKRALSVSLSFLPAPEVNTVAPPAAPANDANAALFYARALQTYASRTAQQPFLPPSQAEAQDILQGAHRSQCHFVDAHLPPFQDAQTGQMPYTFPALPDQKVRYLSAAVQLSVVLARQTPPAQRQEMGRALVRFGEGLGRERATRLHLAVSTLVQKQGVQLLLLSSPTPALQRYVDARELFDEAVQTKYALLEPANAGNLLLQTRVAQHDADPLWRREGVWAALGTLSRPRFSWAHPLEAAEAKAALAVIASKDAEPSVRAAAANALGRLAQSGGATIRR